MSAAVLVAIPDPADCPNCDGQGVTSVRLFGRHVVDEYVETPCVVCQGLGIVDAEAVREAVQEREDHYRREAESAAS